MRTLVAKRCLLIAGRLTLDLDSVTVGLEHSLSLRLVILALYPVAVLVTVLLGLIVVFFVVEGLMLSWIDLLTRLVVGVEDARLL